jgi:hypothetical protein
MSEQLWEQAAVTAEVLEKDGFWCARWSEPNKDIVGRVTVARVDVLRLGPSAGPKAITREKAELIADEQAFRELRSRTIPAVTSAELHRWVETLLQMDAAPSSKAGHHA